MSTHSHRHSSRPTWTRLRGGFQDDESNVVPKQQQIERSDSRQPLEMTYSNPQSASVAYNCGLLKSDYNISSNAPRIRLAFRYHLQSKLRHEDEQSKGGISPTCSDEHADTFDDDLLYLCWIRQDGIPCHFRKMIPACAAAPESDEEQDSINHGGGIGQIYVNEHDAIESTFPGHAFVFCRRVASYEHRQRGSDFIDADSTKPIIVQDDHGHTIFLRRKRKGRKCDVNVSSENVEVTQHMRENTGSEDCKNNACNDWEAYLVIGGFRPGSLPGFSSPMDEDKMTSEPNDFVGLDETIKSSEDEDCTDEESDDEMELQVQLISIRRTKMSSSADNKGEISIESGSAQNEILNQGAAESPSQRQWIADNLEVTACIAYIDPTPIDMSSKIYEHVTLGGWPCRIEPGSFQDDATTKKTKTTTCSLKSRFEKDIAAACASLPPLAREKLQSSTPIWINKSHMWGPKLAPVRGRDACFHPGAKWLSRNGDNPLKCGGVEFYNAKHYLSDCDHWGTGGLILHELCHAWHNIHIADGYDNNEIKECYKLAMSDGLYDCVPVHGPQGPKCKAYACTDPMEYFAELSVAFLGGLDDTLEHNKWYPFNRSQLKEHDPRAWDLLCRMWGIADADEGVDET